MKQDAMEQVTREAIGKTVEEAFGGKEQLREFADSTLRKLLQDLVNSFMVTDREMFIKKNDDVGNGFYPRGLQTPIGNLDLQVPRTRYQSFRSGIIPAPYKRTDPSQEDFLYALIINGYSPHNLRNVLKSMDLGYPQQEIERIIDQLRQRMGGFFQSQDILGINIILQLDALKAGKWKSVIPHFKNHEYELLQMHRAKFIIANPLNNLDLKRIEREMSDVENDPGTSLSSTQEMNHEPQTLIRKN